MRNIVIITNVDHCKIILEDKLICACETIGIKKKTKELGLDNNELELNVIIDPVPSLFTFNIPTESIKELIGIVAPNVSVKIQGSKQKQDGSLLITHWGLSGPGILKTSAFGARTFAHFNYQFDIQIN